MAATYEYLAGLIDGDGCVSLYKKKDKKARTGFTFAPFLVVTSTNTAFLLALKKNYGGYLDSQGKGDYCGTPMFRLQFSSNEIRTLLPLLIPHLVLKKEEACLLLEALTLTKDHRTKDYNVFPKLERIVSSLKTLKKNREVSYGCVV